MDERGGTGICEGVALEKCSREEKLGRGDRLLER
jgi:hypothetical protein